MMYRAFLWVWAIAWHAALPVVLAYIYARARREPVYGQAIGERFGGGTPIAPGAIWIHAVSLGEFRAACPLILALLARGERVLITNITAAGRQEAFKIFASDIVAGRVYVRWCPLELPWAIHRFLRRCQPRFGMIMEIELWPQLITQSARRIPMVMAQAQYPDKSFTRDQKGLARFRAKCLTDFTLILAKSDRHAERFCHLGASDVRVVGELRFEQPIPTAQRTAAAELLKQIDSARPRFCLASTAPDEDALLIPVLKKLNAQTPKPFFIYVPRHPKDFSVTQTRLKQAGLQMLQRSQDLTDDLILKTPIPPECDGLFGDSLGEIYFYYALAQRVFVGDSFNGEGAHNIIEPLRLFAPVAVGPSIWGIEYPGADAMKVGILTKLETPDDLYTHWSVPPINDQTQTIERFLEAHGQATQRIVKNLNNAGLLP
ncbi:MAG: glycosyltransferase N-terminal domain-containing protein [Pseudomonadota bacterium]